MDDADGGVRGSRPTMSSDLRRALESHWGLSGDPVDVGGSSSLNLRVGDVVVRVHRQHVTPSRVDALARARSALAGVAPVAPAVPTRDGAPWARVGESLVEVERYVGHDAVMDSWDRLATGLELLGRVHARLLSVQDLGPPPLFGNHVSATSVVAWTSRAVARVPALVPFAALGTRVAAAADLPGQLVHGDFWHDNLLFRGGAPVLLADFDFMGVRPRIDDLAYPLHCALADLPGASLPRLASLLSAYDAGATVPLSAEERGELPVSIARQALSAMVWVARLDSLDAARAHAESALPALRAASALMDDLPRWRAAFATGTQERV